MGLLNNLYDWGLPNQNQYLAERKDNEALYNQARSLWNSIDTANIYFLVTAFAVAMILVCFYYYVYNKLPGRKYRITHWAIWLAVTAVLTIILTFVLGDVLVNSGLNEKSGFILRISLINGLYASVIYLIASLVICNLPVPTNAYRFLKFGK